MSEPTVDDVLAFGSALQDAPTISVDTETPHVGRATMRQPAVRPESFDGGICIDLGLVAEPHETNPDLVNVGAFGGGYSELRCVLSREGIKVLAEMVGYHVLERQ